MAVVVLAESGLLASLLDPLLAGPERGKADTLRCRVGAGDRRKGGDNVSRMAHAVKGGEDGRGRGQGRGLSEARRRARLADAACYWAKGRRAEWVLT